MSALILLGAAFAAGLHTGIPVRGVDGLGEPTFKGVDAGWSASVEGGYVRVFVGRTEAEAATWLAEGLPLAGGEAPFYRFADEAWGDGDALLAFRDGNVGVFVRVSSGARGIGERLQAAIVDDGPPWPSPPVLARQGERWVLQVGELGGVRFRGGRLADAPGWVFTREPVELVVWDPWGRPAVVRAP